MNYEFGNPVRDGMLVENNSKEAAIRIKNIKIK
jgi:hypothetical protein